jgi:hypothetical protein
MKSNDLRIGNSNIYVIGYNVTIIAAVADYKAQMFNLKTKVYE